MNRRTFGLLDVVNQKELNARIHTPKIVGQLGVFGDREPQSSCDSCASKLLGQNDDESRVRSNETGTGYIGGVDQWRIRTEQSVQ